MDTALPSNITSTQRTAFFLELEWQQQQQTTMIFF